MAKIEMVPVKSSNIQSIGYDDEAKELHVIFKNGGHYAYQTEKSIHSEMLAADSIGGFLASRIKPKFKFRKIK